MLREGFQKNSANCEKLPREHKRLEEEEEEEEDKEEEDKEEEDKDEADDEGDEYSKADEQ